MIAIHGTCHPRFAAVRDLFAANFESGAETGASFAVTHEGELVVDLWAGHADAEGTRPWTADTIVNVYSTTKTMCALTALWLADQGGLDFSRPVAHYWPEFAAAGKRDITVAQLMAHSAGLSGWRAPMTTADLYDWEKACHLLAAQEPLWAPGSAPGYHGITQGFLVGEVVRRIAGGTLGQLFAAEIAGPLGADFHIGLPESEDGRVADLIAPPAGARLSEGELSPLAANMMTNPPVDPRDTRTRAWRAAEIPAANGHGNARSVALIQTVMANGGVANGRRLLSEAGVRRALEEQIAGDDLVLGLPVRFGLGYGLPGPVRPLPNPDTVFWGGYGGSLVIADMNARLCIAYAMNRMAPTTVGDMRAGLMAAAVWQALAGDGPG
jgi:CubicO group peptidase (beta-lactamase class C family)